MKHADVEFLKDQNTDGQQIIKALVEHSETFKDRTVFSQVKYLRKKKEKYAVWFEARRPTALNLCETYHRSSPDRICFLRPDSLALLLNLANLSFQSRVLLVENTKGFLQGALIERSIAYGTRVEFNENLSQLGDQSTCQL